VWALVVTATRPALLKRFLALALPGAFMMAFEAGSFDVTTVMAGHLGPVTTAAHSALLSMIGLSFVSFPFAIATAATIRVGNLVGAGRPHSAHKCGYLAVGAAGAFMALVAVNLLIFRHAIGRVFSDDPEVVAIMAGIAPFAALLQVSDGLMGSSSGVLRGVGKQALMLVFNFVGFWPCGVGLGYFLCFHAGLGIHGVWIGIASGVTTTGVMTLVTMFRLDWEGEAKIAQERIRDHK
jgi:MATE family multidrug resistance protein